MNLERIREELKSYDGPACRLMEVCGTHTASIVKNGIPSLLSDRIRLVSGPGCPVCVTVTSYIDRLVELSLTENTTVAAFGDLLRVRGSKMSLADAKAMGGHVQMVYSPLEMLDAAGKEKAQRFVFAAVGFETTMPVYAILMKEALHRNLSNVQLLTSLKTMPEVIRWLCRKNEGPEGTKESERSGSRTEGESERSGSRTEGESERSGGGKITGFIAPGHVCAVTGLSEYRSLAKETGLPFIVSGFEGKELLAAIYGLVRERGRGDVWNFYPEVVREEGNPGAREAVEEFFCTADAAWRGMGVIPHSGKILRPEYASFDAGSAGLTKDQVAAGCRCPEVLTGKAEPTECPLFGKVCTPSSPHGSCMVSQEGSCYNYYIGR